MILFQVSYGPRRDPWAFISERCFLVDLYLLENILNREIYFKQGKNISLRSFLHYIDITLICIRKTSWFFFLFNFFDRSERLDLVDKWFGNEKLSTITIFDYSFPGKGEINLTNSTEREREREREKFVGRGLGLCLGLS